MNLFDVAVAAHQDLENFLLNIRDRAWRENNHLDKICPVVDALVISVLTTYECDPIACLRGCKSWEGKCGRGEREKKWW